MSAKHTSGPWTVHPEMGTGEFNVSAPDSADPTSDWQVALVYGGCGYPEDQSPANAALIAAAPELLAAVTAFTDALKAEKAGAMLDLRGAERLASKALASVAPVPVHIKGDGE